jgi:hypothetical protein
MDLCYIHDEQVKKNSKCVVAVCLRDSLLDVEGFSLLKVKNYGKTFNLCESEPFRHQPIAAGLLFTGFLVKEDIIATSGHSTDEKDVTSLRFVFGFEMKDSQTALTQVPNERIYKGVKIIHRAYNRKSGSDWALVRLDRKVEGQTRAKLSEIDISYDQPVYTIGHPCGLPLKYATGGYIRDINKAYFSADLDIYSGNSGSPVFNSITHEVVGMVVRGDDRDFRWTGKCWASVVYPKSGILSKGPQCIRISEFIKYCG